VIKRTEKTMDAKDWIITRLLMAMVHSPASFMFARNKDVTKALAWMGAQTAIESDGFRHNLTEIRAEQAAANLPRPDDLERLTKTLAPKYHTSGFWIPAEPIPDAAQLISCMQNEP
jgi:hypothetical protein